MLQPVLLMLCGPACTAILDDAQYAPDIKLGAREKTVECPANYGECAFDIVSNCDYTAAIIKGSEWLAFSGYDNASLLKLSGSTTLNLSYTADRGYRRSAILVLSAGKRQDTLTVKQMGTYDERIVADTESLAVPGGGGTYSVGITTNLLKKDFAFETVDARDYPLNGKADKFKYSDGVFSFRILQSESRDEKTFIVRLYAIDGWGEKVSADITITQKAGRK